MTEAWLKLPIAAGRVHDDYLSPAERAVCDWLAELADDRLRAIVRELLAIEGMRIEVLAALIEDEGEQE